MIAEPSTRQIVSSVPSGRAIHGLIGERGFGRARALGEVNEGTIFPDGKESMSRARRRRAGHTYAFWTAWDSEQQGPVFTIWHEVTPEGRWLTDTEYLQGAAGDWPGSPCEPAHLTCAIARRLRGWPRMVR